MAEVVVIKIDPKEIAKVKGHYKDFLRDKTPQHASFAAKKGLVVITGYLSGKLMFQGPGAQQEAASWESLTVHAPQKETKNKTATAKTKQSQLPENFSSLSVLGSDEVGNGSYFGPLIVCAAFADKKQHALLKELGVRDSKELKDQEIQQIASDLRTFLPYKLLTVPPVKYNQIQPKYNAVHMKVALHNQAIALLLEEILPQKPDAILIDQFTPEKNYQKYVASEKMKVQQKINFVTKGEQHHLAVAAASILSRAAFVDWLSEASKEIGFTLPSGAGANVDAVATRVLKKGGLPLLGNYAKLHFANTKKAQAKL